MEKESNMLDSTTTSLLGTLLLTWVSGSAIKGMAVLEIISSPMIECGLRMCQLFGRQYAPVWYPDGS